MCQEKHLGLIRAPSLCCDDYGWKSHGTPAHVNKFVVPKNNLVCMTLFRFADKLQKSYRELSDTTHST